MRRVRKKRGRAATNTRGIGAIIIQRITNTSNARVKISRRFISI
jgi:hypothetical protein